MLIYALCWVAYLAAAFVLYHFYLRDHMPPWFPNSYPIVRLLVLCLLFSPALMVENGSVYIAPTPMALGFQMLQKSGIGMLKASVVWLLVTGIAFLVAAQWRRHHADAGSQPD